MINWIRSIFVNLGWIKPSYQKITEYIYDQKGNLMWIEPYCFRGLFSPGQSMIIDFIPMTVISCELETNIVTTIVSIGG